MDNLIADINTRQMIMLKRSGSMHQGKADVVFFSLDCS